MKTKTNKTIIDEVLKECGLKDWIPLDLVDKIGLYGIYKMIIEKALTLKEADEIKRWNDFKKELRKTDFLFRVDEGTVFTDKYVNAIELMIDKRLQELKK
jgi:hypothetical protein